MLQPARGRDFDKILTYSDVIPYAMAVEPSCPFLSDELAVCHKAVDALRRLQRFFAKYVLDLDIIARMIFSLLPVKTGLVLSMDRTNWKSRILSQVEGLTIQKF